MSRKLPIWRGKSDDTPVPLRVKLRVLEAYGNVCQCGCGIMMKPGDQIEFDHYVAIVKGGANSEQNIRPLLKAHHLEKTKIDVAEKARTARVRAAHLGIKRPRKRWGYGRADPFKKKLSGEIVRRS